MEQDGREEMNEFESRVKDTIARHSLFDDGQKVLVALSGGSDSVALLCVLKRMGYDCSAVHFNFHLRGDESMRDERFVRNLCRQKDVELFVSECNTEKYAAETGQSIEMAARELRYAFFAEIAERTGAAVAVAHHRDDNVETLLLNIIRGTGLRGLCGMPYKAERTFAGRKPMIVARPLLDVSRNDILGYLKEMNQIYVSDSTNFVADVKRNKLRLELIPEMLRINPSLCDTLQGEILKFSSAYAIYRNAVDAVLGKTERNVWGDEMLRLKSIDVCVSPEAVIFEWLSPKGFNGTQIRQIYESRNVQGKRVENGSYMLVADKLRLVLINKSTLPECGENEISAQCTTSVSGIKIHMSVELVKPTAIELRNPQNAFFDAANLRLPLVVRPVLPGDRFVPFGMRGSKLVSDFLKDRKIPVEQRLRQLLVCDSEKILWVVGLQTDNRVRLSADTKSIVALKLC